MGEETKCMHNFGGEDFSESADLEDRGDELIT
jgi:hypothetical protein